MFEFTKEQLIEQIALASELRARDGRDCVSHRVYEQVIKPLVEALEKAQQAANINNWWKPDVCPITGRRFFMWIEHPELGNVPTYGGPFDSYTIPTKDSNGEFNCERYDHDSGDWVDSEYVGVQIVSDEEEIVTDSILREAEARGVEKLASLAGNKCQRYKSVNNRAGVRQWKSIVILCSDFATQLRKGDES